MNPPTHQPHGETAAQASTPDRRFLPEAAVDDFVGVLNHTLIRFGPDSFLPPTGSVTAPG